MFHSSENHPCSSCNIRSHHLFRHLSEKELQEISLNKITETHPRGSIIYREGSRMKGFFCIQKGIVKIFKTGFDGKEQIIRFSKEGDLIGYRSVISNEPACSTSQVIEDTTVCQIPADLLISLVKTNGNFAVELMKLSCRELGEANSYITDIAQKTVRERLAEVLILLENDFGRNNEGHLNISLTREELSNIVGTATESVIRLLSELRSEGLLDLQGRKIKILDRPGLKYIASM